MSLYDLSLEPPLVRELGDDPGTNCLEGDPDEPCEGRLSCHLCDGVVCTEHDDVADCGDGPAHEACHQQGCANVGCEQDRRDDALLERDGD
jgi:hypothetical protein